MSKRPLYILARFLLCYPATYTWFLFFGYSPRTWIGWVLICIPNVAMYLFCQYCLLPIFKELVVKEHFGGLVKEIELRKEFEREKKEWFKK